ncbi:MAG: histidine phosphatase family protein [Chloroflexi bacterium]|jgi:broad specificity phosphatase PhoE|nr:histidine phosphatase family protein [Chloroflexota bacterium]MBT4001843.1 histidine phosphatase family protein [Chloroflexota bacterium]MBT4304858.1 histidine phosphatase family protein [Chloroflexota bacterium]MBT4534641.1 histidine phosphatase family protein [Chloroflexota bacterium]MBT4683724.1 histidine phosphatase family protein [Chloroflexota bacterium]
MKRIWFIRHGESESNAGLPSKDPGSPPLTQRGRGQAEYVAKYINEKPDLIITSSYIRTQETAAPTLKKFSDVPTDIWPVEEFTYLSSLLFANTTVSQRRRSGMRFWKKRDPAYHDGPGAESFNDLFARAEKTFELIRKSDAKSLLIFSHGWFIRAILHRLYFQPDENNLYRKADVKTLRERKYISAMATAYFNLRKVPNDKQKMLHYLAFSSTFQIPNTAILKFSLGEEKKFEFLEKYTKHIPPELKGNFLVDR